MTHEFEIRKDVELPATPEQVWEAIATGPGISSWFMGPHLIEPHEGGKITLDIPGSPEVGRVTTWEPPHRFANQGETAPDGSFHAFEYLVEGRDGASTVLRFVHSGRTGDDWHDEYETMTGYGWDMYLATLAEYLTHFPGRFATYITASGPEQATGDDAWPKLERALGLDHPVRVGDKVRLTPSGMPPIEGEVDFTHEQFLGIRTSDAMYRFHGLSKLDMPPSVGHHIFSEIDPMATMDAWQAFMTGALADPE